MLFDLCVSQMKIGKLLTTTHVFRNIARLFSLLIQFVRARVSFMVSIKLVATLIISRLSIGEIRAVRG